MAEQKKILIIDDEPDTVAYFSNLLENNGFYVVSAESGDTGLKILGEFTPDLITLDVSMPEMSGLKLYKVLRDDVKFRSIPVLFITGVSKHFEQYISSSNQVPPPEGYISKPVDRAELISMAQVLTMSA
jgi:CheY-like chemotaxis protein